jgi:hypothetical protein
MKLPIGDEMVSVVNEMASTVDASTLDPSVEKFRRDATRRDKATGQLFARIESALRQIAQAPIVQQDAHCQELLARMARAETTDAFYDCVADLHFHIGRLRAQTSGLSVGMNEERLPVVNGDAPLVASKAAAKTGRYLIRL